MRTISRMLRPLRAAQRVLNHLLPPAVPPSAFPIEATSRELHDLERCQPYTMTSPPRQWSMLSAVKYVSRARIPGAIVECGVWRGGMMMLAALTLLRHGDAERELVLFDTFTGMTPPSDADRSALLGGLHAVDIWKQHTGRDDLAGWCEASLDDVRRNMGFTGYPQNRIRYVQGPVEQTLVDPMNLSASIALLRLDTDWYESTRMELEVLYPRLSANGVLLLDDYGYWDGARRAADEFFAHRPVLLNVVDYTGRALIKSI